MRAAIVLSGISHIVGSVSEGLLADLVLWSPMFFGVKPKTIIKGGQIVCSEMGMFLVATKSTPLVSVSNIQLHRYCSLCSCVQA